MLSESYPRIAVPSDDRIHDLLMFRRPTRSDRVSEPPFRLEATCLRFVEAIVPSNQLRAVSWAGWVLPIHPLFSFAETCAPALTDSYLAGLLRSVHVGMHEMIASSLGC